MKKILLISILIAWIFLVWCSQDDCYNFLENNDFEKKKECATYIDNIYKYEKQHRESMNYTSEYWIDEVFYSPVVDSCLYVVKEIFPDEITYKSMFIIDALTLKIINSQLILRSSIYDGTAWKQEIDFEIIINELKVE